MSRKQATRLYPHLVSLATMTRAFPAVGSPKAAMVSIGSSAFAIFVACASHSLISISPVGSTILTPLSRAGLCEAVSITPTCADLRDIDRSAATRPVRNTAAGSRSALKVT